MKSRTGKFWKMVSIVCVLFVGLLVLDGCKKQSEPVPPPPETTEEAVSTAVEQTVCPVMGGRKINKEIFTEYKGKKVYFCCPECKEKFEKEPEKYISKLPQFKN